MTQGELDMRMKKGMIVLLALIIAGCAGAGNTPEPEATPIAESPTTSPTGTATSPASESPSESPIASEAVEPPEAVLNTESLSPLFAFADEEGTRLMALTDGMEEPDAVKEGTLDNYRLAIGEGGRQALRIRYEKHQARSEQDNGRQAAYNFDNMEGDIYAIEEGKATPNESYYLVTEEQFDVRALIPLKPSADLELPDDAAQKIAEAKGRAIEHGWLLAHAQDGRRIYVIEFQRQGEDMLASLVWEEDNRLLWMDYPAAYDENSTWRVDDGGEISPDMFRFLFAARGADDGIVLGVQWLGAEGENLTVLRSSGDRFEETGISGGRYLSPI